MASGKHLLVRCGADTGLAAPTARDDAAEDPGTRLFVSLRKRF